MVLTVVTLKARRVHLARDGLTDYQGGAGDLLNIMKNTDFEQYKDKVSFWVGFVVSWLGLGWVTSLACLLVWITKDSLLPSQCPSYPTHPPTHLPPNTGRQGLSGPIRRPLHGRAGQGGGHLLRPKHPGRVIG